MRKHFLRKCSCNIGKIQGNQFGDVGLIHSSPYHLQHAHLEQPQADFLAPPHLQSVPQLQVDPLLV